MTFFEIAEPLIRRGLPVVPLRPRTKIAFFSDWPGKATIDPEQIKSWNTQFSDANCACVAQAKIGGFCIWEVDAPEAIQRCESDTGRKIPRTFRVRSRIGRGHVYFKQTEASIACGNIGQNFVRHGDWSFREDRQYVVGANSLHPDSGKPYEIVSTAEIVGIPDWLVSWLVSQKLDEKQVRAKIVSGEGPIISGQRNSTLASIAGKARQAMSMTVGELEAYLLQVNKDRCLPPLDEPEVRTIAASIARYEVKDTTVIVNGRLAGSASISPITLSLPTEPIEDEPPAKFIVPPYPVFPSWVMYGTSIYKGLVEPVCAVNSRYPEFMFMPAIAILLNYLGTKVHIECKNLPLSLFMVLIGKRGVLKKSFSVQDAVRYFSQAGLADHAGPAIRNAEGKTLIWTAGSPEGLGIDMQGKNCKNAILFYDELSTLINKAGIESSALTSNLLTMYESGKFANTTKAKKEVYSHDPGTYCASLVACTTDKNFAPLWGRMAGKTSGLNDRFFFLYQPEVLKEETPFIDVGTQPGALETRKLVDKAILQGSYRITDQSPLCSVLNAKDRDRLENRQEIRAEKFALAFAVDLGLDEIDEECIERGLALVKYEQQVKRWLRTTETYTREASIQAEVVNFLLTSKNRYATMRQLDRAVQPGRYGTSVWSKALGGLLQSGQIGILGDNSSGNPQRYTLLRIPEEDDD